MKFHKFESKRQLEKINNTRMTENTSYEVSHYASPAWCHQTSQHMNLGWKSQMTCTRMYETSEKRQMRGAALGELWRYRRRTVLESKPSMQLSKLVADNISKASSHRRASRCPTCIWVSAEGTYIFYNSYELVCRSMSLLVSSRFLCFLFLYLLTFTRQNEQQKMGIIQRHGGTLPTRVWYFGCIKVLVIRTYVALLISTSSMSDKQRHCLQLRSLGLMSPFRGFIVPSCSVQLIVVAWL